MIELRPYQKTGLNILEHAVASHTTRPLISWSTGLGKTVLFAHWIARRPGRALVIAHREELLDQAADKLATVLGSSAEVGVVQADRDGVEKRIVVGSIQTLSRPARLAALLNEGAFATVVVDEAHHSEAPTYKRLLRVLKAAGDPPVLGVTATPARGDKKSLGRTWQRVIHTVSILDGIKLGYLVNLRAHRIRVNANFNDLHSRHGDIVEGEAERMLLDASAPQCIADSVAQFAVGRPTLVFTVGVELARKTAFALSAKGIPATFLSGDTPRQERHAILQDLREGRTHAICNCNVLTEGYDEPRVSCIVVARPTQSQPFYAQMVGRGTRPFPGKDDCLILDVVGASIRHDLVTLPHLFGGEVRDEARAAIERGTGVREALDQSPLTGDLQRDTIRERKFSWVGLRSGWVLSLGKGSGMLLLTEVPAGWEVTQRWDDGTEDRLWQGASLEWAHGIAEEHVRRAGAQGLVSVDAPWRAAAASLAQKAALVKFGLGCPDGLTKGEAADMLTRAIAGLRRRRA
jgi:ATP-dependent helicase IRC3